MSQENFFKDPHSSHNAETKLFKQNDDNSIQTVRNCRNIFIRLCSAIDRDLGNDRFCKTDATETKFKTTIM